MLERADQGRLRAQVGSTPASAMRRGMRSARSMRHAVRCRSMTTTSVAAVAMSHGSPGVCPGLERLAGAVDDRRAPVGRVGAHDAPAARVQDPQRAVARGHHVGRVDVLEAGGEVDHRGGRRRRARPGTARRGAGRSGPAAARAAPRRRRRRRRARRRRARRPAARPPAPGRGRRGPRRRRAPRRHAPARPPRRSPRARRWRAGWRRSGARTAGPPRSIRPPGCPRRRPCRPARPGGAGPARAPRCAGCCADTPGADAARRRGSRTSASGRRDRTPPSRPRRRRRRGAGRGRSHRPAGPGSGPAARRTARRDAPARAGGWSRWRRSSVTSMARMPSEPVPPRMAKRCWRCSTAWPGAWRRAPP